MRSSVLVIGAAVLGFAACAAGLTAVAIGIEVADGLGGAEQGWATAVKPKPSGAPAREVKPAGDRESVGEAEFAAEAETVRGPESAGDGEAAAKYFTNTELVDQHGRPHRFYDGLIRGRKVLINFAFTTCKGVCPGMTANLARVQKRLGARVGKEISILTITVDPVNDTPAALAKFAAKFDASPGWYFLTGTPENVATVLGRLGGLAKTPDEHASALLIGDASSGYWVKTVATSRPEDIVYLVDHVADER